MTVDEIHPMPHRNEPPPAWFVPEGEQGGLPRYLQAIRAGIAIVVVTTVVCVLVAALYLARTDKVYEAGADLLISPQSIDVPVAGLIIQSSDPSRDVETVSRLVRSPATLTAAAATLGRDDSATELATQVEVVPVAQSNIITVTAKGTSAKAAADLANAVARTFVQQRTRDLHATLDGEIERVRSQLADAQTNGAAEQSAAEQLQVLESLRGQPDPSIGVASAAQPPQAASSPRPLLTVAGALIGGAVLGILGAFGVQLLDPRLRREEQLRAMFRVPILARIPIERRRRGRPLLPSELSIGALDGYQALRAALTVGDDARLSGRSVLVTGPSPGDGKTTAAINMASVMAAAGRRVILVEADTRRPSVGRALDLQPEIGLSMVASGQRYLVDALVPVGEADSNLRVLLTSPTEAPAADVLSYLSADTLLLQAQRLADWVVVDSPPLNHVAETVALARAVDRVVLVVRVGKTNVRDLTELAEMLQQQEIQPAGFVVIGGHARPGYY